MVAQRAEARKRLAVRANAAQPAAGACLILHSFTCLLALAFYTTCRKPCTSCINASQDPSFVCSQQVSSPRRQTAALSPRSLPVSRGQMRWRQTSPTARQEPLTSLGTMQLLEQSLSPGQPPNPSAVLVQRRRRQSAGQTAALLPASRRAKRRQRPARQPLTRRQRVRALHLTTGHTAAAQIRPTSGPASAAGQAAAQALQRTRRRQPARPAAPPAPERKSLHRLTYQLRRHPLMQRRLRRLAGGPAALRCAPVGPPHPRSRQRLGRLPGQRSPQLSRRRSARQRTLEQWQRPRRPKAAAAGGSEQPPAERRIQGRPRAAAAAGSCRGRPALQPEDRQEQRQLQPVRAPLSGPTAPARTRRRTTASRATPSTSSGCRGAAPMVCLCLFLTCVLECNC